MRRLPPNKIEQNLSGLLNLLPDETDELLQRVDQPLEEATCKDTVDIILMILMYLHSLMPPLSPCLLRVESFCFAITTEMAIHTGMRSGYAWANCQRYELSMEFITP